MKQNFILLLSVLTLIFGSCKDSTSESLLEVSTTTVRVSSNSSMAIIHVTSNSSWKITSNSSWCTPDKEQGHTNDSIMFRLLENINITSRTANVVVSSGKMSRTIQFIQEAGNPTAAEQYHYELPVVFHLLYDNESNPNQYVKKGHCAKLIEACNKLYQDKLNASSADMNLTFTLATQDPQGNSLSEPGVNRVRWNTPTMDCENFMLGKNSNGTANDSYVNILWNPDQYINIIVYTFTKSNILGISHLPYSLSTAYLEGLNKIDFVPRLENLKFPLCLSLNNNYIYVQSTEQTYDMTDAVVTLAHELGHYLGLHHAFFENEDTDTSSCRDTDYCRDTPSYNREAYSNWITSIKDINQYTFAQLITRKDCSGHTFLSRNIMDYWFCQSDQFTNDQQTRIRHVLNNSPLIPGPKKHHSIQPTRSLSGKQDLPIRYLK